MNELQKRIEFLMRKLEALRDEFDRVDANNPKRAIEVVRDIHECSADLESLLKFQELMHKGGVE